MRKDLALRKLTAAIAEIDNLMSLRHGSNQFVKWHRNTMVALGKIFGEGSHAVDEFSSINFVPKLVLVGGGEHQFQEPYLGGLNISRGVLESMKEEVAEYWNESGRASTTKSAAQKKKKSAQNQTKNVFIIHGRDEALKETIARFVTKLGYSPTILHEQPSGGRTIIEKFEKNADACFAIALLTPDDSGALMGERELKSRARQNVILELGYFLGSLGRRRVFALLKGEDIEVPSDYTGVVYTQLDSSGAWRFTLVREMKAAGLEVDANRVI